MSMDDNKEENKGLKTVEWKTRQRELPTKEEETLVLLNKARRQRGFITKLPKFIPPPNDPEGTILSMTPQEQDKLLEDMLSHPEKMIFKHDLYRDSARKLDELSLAEVDDIARGVLYADGEYPIRKKKRVVSIGKQKKNVASSSKRPRTNA